jgi:hypothetical protein
MPNGRQHLRLRQRHQEGAERAGVMQSCRRPIIESVVHWCNGSGEVRRDGAQDDIRTMAVVSVSGDHNGGTALDACNAKESQLRPLRLLSGLPLVPRLIALVIPPIRCFNGCGDKGAMSVLLRFTYEPLMQFFIYMLHLFGAQLS